MTRATGFTLIELLVVVSVLAATALLAFGFSAEDRAQIRYDDTRHRLEALHRAILGRLGPVADERLGGFVADNGDLPETVLALLQAGTLTAQAAVQPLFDPQPDTATCANNGGEITLSDTGATLIKGHRGDYLGGLAMNHVFRDGWGNPHADTVQDAANFGWILTANGVARSLAVTSLGADNAAGGGSTHEADRSLNIAAADWLVPLAGWTVEVVNYSGADIPARPYSVALLVFHNDSSGGYWQRYASAAVSSCLDGTGDGLLNGTSACPRSLSLSFSAGCHPGDSGTGHDKIPQGRHLLVLVDDADGSPWTTDDQPYTVVGSSPVRHVFAQVDFVAGLAPPATRLEIR